MVAIYKIHPGIGFARVGRSSNGFFLTPETIGGSPFELGPNGVAAFQGYKDANNVIRRQAARFCVYEYDKNMTTGELRLVREITPDIATVHWEVKLANRKAAGLFMSQGPGPDNSVVTVPDPNSFRNSPPPGGTREDLVAAVGLSVTGVNTPPGPRQTGTIAGQAVFIGEVATDNKGRLLVLGGHGVSGSWVNPAPVLGDYLNNEGWYDDVADGPIDATLSFPGAGEQIAVDEGAWVAIGPPDFAPDVEPIVSLFDIMMDRLKLAVPPAISFVQDVLPILHRVASYFWVNRRLGPTWKAVRSAIETNLAGLADPSDSSDEVRKNVFDAVMASEGLRELRFTASQDEILADWRDGSFLPGPDPSRPVETEADILDRLHLARAIGGGFFPGIEAGFIMTYAVYSEKARLTRGDFKDFDDQMRRLRPGSLTERMAVPWQADFVECEGLWWPAQRPDIAVFAATGEPLPSNTRWDRLVAVNAPDGGFAHNSPSRTNMVAHFAKLGVIEKRKIGGSEIFVEVGRASDSEFSTGT
jgi:hypothetical protein